MMWNRSSMCCATSRTSGPSSCTHHDQGRAAPAEAGSPTKWHAPGLFNKNTGEIIKVAPKSPAPPKYQDVFGHTIIELAEKDERIVGVTPAMPTGCSLKFMMEAMPDRAFDVGIAEQHAVTFSAGMATQGLVPFCNIYSSFMQRAYDQVLHDGPPEAPRGLLRRPGRWLAPTDPRTTACLTSPTCGASPT